MPRPLCWLMVATLGAMPLAAQPEEPAALGEALRAAVARALPFPEARPDGTPVGGATEPVWAVRWPDAGELYIEVLANPLNPINSRRALQAEAEIQKAVMASQRRSQGDYDRAVSDFRQTGKVGEIREVTLSDEGVAGERYDAESQLTIRAEAFTGTHQLIIATARRPEVHRGDGGATVVRVTTHTYEGSDAPGTMHFAPEQAWLFFGVDGVIAGEGPDDPSATLTATPSAGAQRGVVVSIRGNAELVNRVLQESDWKAFNARLAG